MYKQIGQLFAHFRHWIANENFVRVCVCYVNKPKTAFWLCLQINTIANIGTTDFFVYYITTSGKHVPMTVVDVRLGAHSCSI